MVTPPFGLNCDPSPNPRPPHEQQWIDATAREVYPEGIPGQGSDLCTSTGTVQIPDEIIRMKPDPFAPSYDRFSRAVSSMKQQIPDTEELPLKTPEANAVLKKIRDKWPDYPIDQAMVTASGIWTKFGEKLDVPGILEDAIFAWPPGRSIWEKNGVHGWLTSFFLSREKDAQKAAQTPSRGKGGIPHQAEASKASLTTRLLRIDDGLKQGGYLDPIELVGTWNEAIEDKVPVGNRLRHFIRQLSERHRVELGSSLKILDHNLPGKSMTPKELLKGPQLADPDFVKEQLKGLRSRGGVK
jgi:hypothetical protein